MKFDAGFAEFSAIQLIGCSDFCLKRVGYLSTPILFESGSELSLLAANVIKKDLESSESLVVELALTNLAHFPLAELQETVFPSLLALASSQNIALKKKVVQCLLLTDPSSHSFRLGLNQLSCFLKDPDPGVQGAAITSLCQLASKSPSLVLPLSLDLFQILVNSSDNMILIKLVKIFGALLKIELRLSKKLLDPFISILRTTEYVPLAVEIIDCISRNIPSQRMAVQYCLLRLREILNSEKANLHVLGLRIIQSVLSHHRDLAEGFRAFVASCLDSVEKSVRVQGLQLLTEMTTPENFVTTIEVLLIHLEGSSEVDKDEVAMAILKISEAQDLRVQGLLWYLGILVRLVVIPGITVQEKICSEIIGLFENEVEVKNDEGLKRVQRILQDAPIWLGTGDNLKYEKAMITSAKLLGEYAGILGKDLTVQVTESLVQPVICQVSPSGRVILVETLVKILVANESGAREKVLNLVQENSNVFLSGENLSVDLQDMLGTLSAVIEELEKNREGDSLETKENKALIEGLNFVFNWKDNEGLSEFFKKKLELDQSLDLCQDLESLNRFWGNEGEREWEGFFPFSSQGSTSNLVDLSQERQVLPIFQVGDEERQAFLLSSQPEDDGFPVIEEGSEGQGRLTKKKGLGERLIAEAKWS